MTRPSPRERKERSRGTSSRNKHHRYEEWVKIRLKIRLADIRRKTRAKAISDFVRRVMPDRATSNRALPSPDSELAKQVIVPKVEARTPLKKTRPLSPLPSTSREILYETPKQGYDDGVTEEEQTEEGNVRTVASPRNLLDTQYCSVTRLGEYWLATSWPTAWVKVLRLCFPMNNDTDLFEVAVTLVVIVKYS